MESHEEKAAARFAGGFNCAQAVFGAFADTVGLREEDSLRIATAFGAGMGRQQEVCGAVTGAYMVLGAKYGMADSSNPEAKQKTYDLVREFTAKFRTLHGSISCRELLGCDMNTEAGRSAIAAGDLHRTVCRPCVRNACTILDTILASEPQQA
jgi:C_GCAxxG_C_C family probable redox protein